MSYGILSVNLVVGEAKLRERSCVRVQLSCAIVFLLPHFVLDSGALDRHDKEKAAKAEAERQQRATMKTIAKVVEAAAKTYCVRILITCCLFLTDHLSFV